MEREEVAQVGLDKALVKVGDVWVALDAVEAVVPRPDRGEGWSAIAMRSGEYALVEVAADDVVAVLASGARAAWPPRRMVGGIGPETVEAMARKMDG